MVIKQSINLLSLKLRSNASSARDLWCHRADPEHLQKRVRSTNDAGNDTTVDICLQQQQLARLSQGHYLHLFYLWPFKYPNSWPFLSVSFSLQLLHLPLDSHTCLFAVDSAIHRAKYKLSTTMCIGYWRSTYSCSSVSGSLRGAHQVVRPASSRCLSLLGQMFRPSYYLGLRKEAQTGTKKLEVFSQSCPPSSSNNNTLCRHKVKGLACGTC